MTCDRVCAAPLLCRYSSSHICQRVGRVVPRRTTVQGMFTDTAQQHHMRLLKYRPYSSRAMAPVNTGASTEGYSLTTGAIVKMVIFLCFCLVARRVRRARSTQTSTLTCNHTPIIRGDAAYSTSILSRASCPRCRANRRKPASAPRAIHSSLMSSPASSSSSPPPPYSRSLSPVQLSELQDLELTGLEERTLPATPPPVYRTVPEAIALTRGRD
ncbi:hypothetical protein C8Q74DRAFT_920497 [Fomes fomentarius]|nr:hypothetical protein C8Q74DRAFT_920497 [Fomes fomentarius]